MTTTVFIAGSRKISRLPAEIEARLDSIVEKGFDVVIGDADGADAACQTYLAARGYAKVTVYCVGHRSLLGYFFALKRRSTALATEIAARSILECSQNLSTVQPAFLRSVFVFRSLLRFPRIFSLHHTAFALGQVP